MKTKDLIAELQKLDPEGELECCVDNADIHFVDRVPAYYDGCLQVLLKDEKGRIQGAKYTSEGVKIKIHTLSVCDAIFDWQDMPVEFEGSYNFDYYKERVESFREQTEEICNDVEGGSFVQYAKNRFAKIRTEDLDVDEVVEAAKKFYKDNMDYRDEMPQDIKMEIKSKEIDGKERAYYPSWHDKRTQQWDREITMDFVDGKIVIKKNGP